jgi:hypothetical protein
MFRRRELLYLFQAVMMVAFGVAIGMILVGLSL